jgi:competence protein ComEA
MSQTSSLESSILSDEGEINSSRDNETETEKYIFVDVKGAVRMPGVYEINSETRLTDVITLAGGFLPTADQSVVNLSQKLTDQMMITIPTLEIKNESTDLNEGEEKVPVVISIPNETSDSQPGKVNINVADISELQTLSGIGEKKAERILQYRQEHGSFKSVEELKEVSGIGDRTFEALADFISVGKN